METVGKFSVSQLTPEQAQKVRESLAKREILDSAAEHVRLWLKIQREAEEEITKAGGGDTQQIRQLSILCAGDVFRAIIGKHPL